MIVVLQRVSRACVRVEGEVVGTIGPGLLALVGAVEGDQESDVDYVAKRLLHTRIFADDADRMNRSLLDVGGQILVVSQFTLAGDTHKGRRPPFVRALAPDLAAPMIDGLIERLRESGVVAQSGIFGAHMEVELVNDGPVTILLDSRQTRRGGYREAID